MPHPGVAGSSRPVPGDSLRGKQNPAFRRLPGPLPCVRLGRIEGRGAEYHPRPGAGRKIPDGRGVPWVLRPGGDRRGRGRDAVLPGGRMVSGHRRGPQPQKHRAAHGHPAGHGPRPEERGRTIGRPRRGGGRRGDRDPPRRTGAAGRRHPGGGHQRGHRGADRRKRTPGSGRQRYDPFRVHQPDRRGPGSLHRLRGGEHRIPHPGAGGERDRQKSAGGKIHHPFFPGLYPGRGRRRRAAGRRSAAYPFRVMERLDLPRAHLPGGLMPLRAAGIGAAELLRGHRRGQPAGHPGKRRRLYGNAGEDPHRGVRQIRPIPSPSPSCGPTKGTSTGTAFHPSRSSAAWASAP